MKLEFLINNQKFSTSQPDCDLTLLEFLRQNALFGTKEGCAEGDCGACTVAVRTSNGYQAINSCITLLPTLHGQDIWTVEGLQSANAGELHPIQRLMVDHAGSQCGYCTPGFIMSMFAEQHRPNAEGFDDHALAGNLCRCTGYTAIRAAARFISRPLPTDPFVQRLAEPLSAPAAFSYQGFYQPQQLLDAVATLDSTPDITLIAGGTDVALQRTTGFRRLPHLMSLSAIPELNTITETPTQWEIGAAVTLDRLEHELANHIPLFSELWPWFASKQIRNRATLGGNIGTASPIGDGLVVLLALDARVVLVSVAGERSLVLSEYFIGYRKTKKQPNEIIKTIVIPKMNPQETTWMYKAAKRGYDDISTVMAAFALRHSNGVIDSVRLAYGGVAAIPARATAVEAWLIGQTWNQDTIDSAATQLSEAFSPLDDARGSAAYRRALVAQLWRKFASEYTAQQEGNP
jgi:xanthine dehydrogenase small subunit